MKKLIIYHNEDNDGLFSAVIANFFEMSPEDDIEFLGLNYAMQKDIVDGNHTAPMTWEHIKHYYDRVILVDFSFPVEKLLELNREYSKKSGFVWNDHHAPIINAVKETGEHISGIQDHTHSALYNTWAYYTDKPIIPILDILQKWDSWTYAPDEEELVRCVNVAATARCELDLDKTMSFFNNIFYSSDQNFIIEDLRRIGLVLVKEQQRANANIIKRSGDCSFSLGPNNAKACLIVLSTGTGSSNFESLKGTDVVHGIVLRRSNIGAWSMSLYNIEENDFHCGNYLHETYGGGGHAGAGGAELTFEQVLKIFQTHHV